TCLQHHNTQCQFARMGPITKSIMSLLRDAKTPPILYQCQPTNSGWILSSPVTQWLPSLVSWQHSFQVDVRSRKHYTLRTFLLRQPLFLPPFHKSPFLTHDSP